MHLNYNEKRIKSRKNSFAHIILLESNIVAYIADISSDGIKVIVPGLDKLNEKPEEVAGIQFSEYGISYFEVNLYFCWKKPTSKSISVGYKILSIPNDESLYLFNKLLNIYK